MPQRDLTILAQDPWFGGGTRALLEAFWYASVELGRRPRLAYVSRERATSFVRRSLALAPRVERDPPFTGTAFPSLLPELDSFNQLSGGLRIAPMLRRSRSFWVVAATAPAGWAAARSDRPYACWIATGLREEWAGRRPGLRPSRRLAIRVNAPVLRRLERDVLRRAAAVYAISEASRESLASAAGLPLGRVRILPIPVDAERFAPEPDNAWRRRLDEPSLVFVGRADDPRKNAELLLRSFPSIRERVPAARLQLVGTPPNTRLGGLLGEGVEVVGEVESVAPHLRRGSLLVLPSLQEGFGIVVAEALASGVPAVVTPCGGPEELVRSSGGGLVLPDFRRDSLVETVSELLGDPERLSDLRRRGREYVAREHAPELFRDRLAAAFEELDG